MTTTEPIPPEESSERAWKLWPMGQAALVDRLRALPPVQRQKLYAEIEEEFGVGAMVDVRSDRERFWYRVGQLVRPEELKRKKMVLFVGNRGDGKTDAAVFLFDMLIRTGVAKYPRLFAANAADVGDITVNGPSGIMSLYEKDDPRRPWWIPRDGPAGIIRYPNGVKVVCFSAEVKKGSVGYGGDVDLYDDVTKWAGKEEAWNHARTSCREGIGLGIVATSTGDGEQKIWDLISGTGESRTTLIKRLGGPDTKPPTRPNVFNLSYRYYEEMEKELGDTDFYRREMLGENVSETSPFAGIDFDSAPIRILSAPRSDFEKVVIAVDPAEGKGGNHDEWGIGAAGIRPDGHVVALDDASGSFDDDEAAAAVIRLCEVWDAYEVVVESNRGSKKVENAIAAAYYRRELEAVKAEGDRPAMLQPTLVPVQAKDGKTLRAGPLKRLYIAGWLHHVPGLHMLEKQMREWKPGGPRRPRQDDRIDWLVHAVTHLADIESLDTGGAQQLGDDFNQQTEQALGAAYRKKDQAPERPNPMAQLLGGKRGQQQQHPGHFSLPKKRLF